MPPLWKGPAEDYTASALSKGSGDPSLGVAGLTEPFTCPTGTPPTAVSLSSFAAAAVEHGRQWIPLLVALLVLALLRLGPEWIRLPFTRSR